jgi:hypothetical protein
MGLLYSFDCYNPIIGGLDQTALKELLNIVSKTDLCNLYKVFIKSHFTFQ